MQQLEIRRPMAREALNPRYYLRSLLAEARRCALISDAEIAAVQAGMQALVLRQAAAWARGRSSSVPAKVAQEIFTSAAFVIGLRLKACAEPEDAVEALRQSAPEALFDAGLELIDRKLTRARLMQRRIEARLFETPNHFYRGTIVDGVNGFFKLYKPQLAAHEIHITADYPPCLGRPELDGIEFIEHYLRRIEAENAFLTCFDADDVHHLLCGVSADYASCPMNLFEPVLLSALGLMLLKRPPRRLELAPAEAARLTARFSAMDAREAQAELSGALAQLSAAMPLPDVAVRYAARCIPGIARGRVCFFAPACPEDAPKLVLSCADRMPDAQYRALIEQIRWADDDKKLGLLLGGIHSIPDLLDALGDAELARDDFAALVERLSPPIVAALMAQYPADDFLQYEWEQWLFDALQAYRRALPPELAAQLDVAVRAIERGGHDGQ